MNVRQASAHRVHKPLPAYGRELLDLRRRGLVPAHRCALVALDCWRWGRGERSWYRLVVAPDQTPADLDFSMVAGLDVLLCYAPSVTLTVRRDLIIRQILRADPASLRLVDMEKPQLGFVIQSRKFGLERAEFAT